MTDRYSSQFLTALPTPRDELLPLEFHETFTTYLGVRSRLMAPYVGRGIPCGAGATRICDPWSFQLGLATLPGGHWTSAHDEIARAVFDLCFEAGLHPELEPQHIFTSLLQPQVLTGMRRGALPSIIPDAMFEAPMPLAQTARPAPGARRSSVRQPSRMLLCGLRRRLFVPRAPSPR